MKEKKLKVRWNRVIVFLFIIIMLIGCFSLQAFGSNKINYENCQKVVVEKGDTIWTLIKEYNPDFYGNMNKAIYKVHCINNMDSSGIFIGQTIYIPLNLK